MIGSAAVFGAGIAGMQASLDLAEMGYLVYLIEKKPCIGGAMAGLDKTFPTNDCAMCIMSPKLVDVGRHPNIRLITNAELASFEGVAGDFNIKLNIKASYVDPSACNGCGDCAEACPVTLPSEHDEGLATRKAIYRRYPQAIPNVFSIGKKGIPACRDACPAHVNVQGYIALLSTGEYEKAYRLILERHPLPSVCGRICHHPCESACKRGDIDEPVAINYLKRFISDRALSGQHSSPGSNGSGEDTVSKDEQIPGLAGRKAAVIGAGPSGLTAAKDLAVAGCTVVIFDREQKAGGTLLTGIPGFRLDKEVLAKETDLLLSFPGIEVRYGVNVGSDMTLEDIRKEGFDTLFLGTGTGTPRDLDIPGIDAEGVLKGIDFLNTVNSGEPAGISGTVLVIGGGNVATDSARSALRCGAEKVTIVYRRTVKEMPAYSWEIEESLEEGIIIEPSWAPVEVVQEDGRVTGLKCIRHIRIYDEHGNFTSRTFPEQETIFQANYIITAIGQRLDTSAFDGFDRITLSSRGWIEADPATLQTGVPWIFAGGDGVTGPASAVEAVAAGHRAAESMIRYLQGEELKRTEPEAQVVTELPDIAVRSTPRHPMPVVPPSERVTSFVELEKGFDEETARAEALRCLSCGECSECGLCTDVCGRDAVDHLMKTRTISIDTGAVILATGYEKFDPSPLLEYGYSRYPNVITSGEFERVLSASGPFGGHVQRPSDGRIPKKIAWIQCVGSRQVRHEGKEYCSGVCCMYAIKEAVIAKEHCTGLECHIYYMDIRSYGKDFEAYYTRARDEYGVSFRKSRLSLVEEVPGSGDLMVKYLGETEHVQEEVYDLIVLSTAMEPSAEKEFTEAFGLPSLNHGFLSTHRFFREQTPVRGVFACGTAVSPMDIPETVASASAAASYAGSLLKEARGELAAVKKETEERDILEEEPRIGIFICHCGINIGSVVDVEKVAAYAGALPDVVYAEQNLYTCSSDTQQQIKDTVLEHNINRVIVASCTPRTHEALFQETLAETGLNPFLFEFVGIREQCSWVHMHTPEEATEKAKELVTMGAARTRFLSPYHRSKFPVNKRGLVIGGGVSGMWAALSLANQGFEAVLVEREHELGGNARDMKYILTGDDIQGFLSSLEQSIGENPLIQVRNGAVVTGLNGYVGNYQTELTIRESGETIEIAHGVIIVATGAELSDTREYSYGESDLVLKQKELEEKLAAGESFDRIAMILCVGSREEGQEYCSRICCQQAMKNVLKAKENNPDTDILVLYRDIRTYGFYESYYQEAREAGVNFVRYEQNSKPVLTLDGENRPVLTFFDHILGKDQEYHTDIAVVTTGISPHQDPDLHKILKIPRTREGFFLEAHAKLKPLDVATEGMFICGLAHSPKNLMESMSQAGGAAARAATLLAKEEITSTGNPVRCIERVCSGCGLCVEICPFDARELDEETGKARIIEVLCQGCGACATACPNAATEQLGFTKKQLYQMIEEVV